MGTWRGHSLQSYSSVKGSENWGAIRLEGDEDGDGDGDGDEEEEEDDTLTMTGSYVRNVGMGIEGGPQVDGSASLSGRRRGRRRRRRNGVDCRHYRLSSSSSTSRATSRSRSRQASPVVLRDDDVHHHHHHTHHHHAQQQHAHQHRDGQVTTTIALLQTFHVHASFHLSVLASLLPPVPLPSPLTGSHSNHNGVSEDEEERPTPTPTPTPTPPMPMSTLQMTPRDMAAFELGPLSGLDVRYVTWLVEEYAGEYRFVMRRGWRDVLGVIFWGYG